MSPSRRDSSTRSEDPFPLAGLNRRVERGVQTCVKPKALSSCLYNAANRRVARLQEQVERLQQRNVEMEDEHRLARQSFQNRLQQLYESWQDCFDRHQHSWSQQKAQAEAMWIEERRQLLAETAHLRQIIAGQPSRELMEDAAVQAGSTSGKSRSSQTPRLSTPRPTTSSSDGIWDLLRTQSLPSDSQEWLDALMSNRASTADFGDAAVEYALTVAQAPEDAFSFFMPLREESDKLAGKTDKAPIPDQSWWEEFGEWESASNDEEYAYSPRALGPLPDWGVISEVAKPKLSIEPVAPAFAGGRNSPFEEEADDEDIWNSLCQPAAMTQVYPRQANGKRAFEESEDLHADPKVQKARFPSPSSNPWGLQESEEVSISITTLAHPKFAAPPSNPWGLQDIALPVMGITFAPTGMANVTYTPVEAFQPLPPTPAHMDAPTKLDSNVFSATTGFPVTFDDDCGDDSTPMIEVLDMSAGDLVSVGGPSVCPVSTKLPPLDHDPMLPPLPEGFVLPPEMHPVVGSYTSTKAKTATTGSQTAPAWSAGSAQVTAGQVKDDSHVQGDREGSGKWLHLKQGPPASKARQNGDMLECAAASMNMTPQDLLAPTPMTDLLRDVMSLTDTSSALPQEALPTFTTRLADSGFMTCQLAQLLAPIRTATSMIESVDSSPTTPPQVSCLGTASAVAPAAPAVVDPAFEASLEAAAESLLADIGIDCSSQLISRVSSDAHSDFEFISRAASDAETAITTEQFGGSQRLGPSVHLAKSTSAIPHSAEPRAFYRPMLHSNGHVSAVLGSTACDRDEEVCSMDEILTESTISLEDVTIDVGNDSGMTIQEGPIGAAMCLAVDDDTPATNRDDVQRWFDQRWAGMARDADMDAESASEDGSMMSSEATLVSASSFIGETMEEADGAAAAGDEWELI
ncbi:hypothetical protein WJX82_004467 [Trebouxia sp. C0006]